MDICHWECVAQVCGSDLCGVTPGPLGPEQSRLPSLNPPFSPGRILGMWVNLLHPYSPQDHFTVKKGKGPPLLRKRELIKGNQMPFRRRCSVCVCVCQCQSVPNVSVQLFISVHLHDSFLTSPLGKHCQPNNVSLRWEYIYLTASKGIGAAHLFLAWFKIRKRALARASSSRIYILPSED